MFISRSHRNLLTTVAVAAGLALGAPAAAHAASAPPPPGPPPAARPAGPPVAVTGVRRRAGRQDPDAPPVGAV